MKNQLRSFTSTQGKRMTGARSLWRANGMKPEQFGKPIIAIVNSFSQFVPGHVHLHKIGQEIKKEIEALGCFAAEFNTIAIDDGIAMGHQGMLYSLPSREIIADSIEYVCNAHRVDAMICISNCDKITPGMLMASMRLNIPSIFVSGGPMEAGKIGKRKLDLVDAIVAGGNKNTTNTELREIEENACPTCGSCSGMFTANSMNCLTEALGLSLPGNGTVVATHSFRKTLFLQAARLIVKNTFDYYKNGHETVLPRNIANKSAFENAMKLDLAMGGSSNTILHLLAIAKEAKVKFKINEIDKLSKETPTICKISPNHSYHIQDLNRAGGVLGILNELYLANIITNNTYRVDRKTLFESIKKFDITQKHVNKRAKETFYAAPGNGERNLSLASQNNQFKSLDTDRKKGCIRSVNFAYSKDAGLAILYGNIAQKGCVVKTAGVTSKTLKFKGKAKVFHSQESACNAILFNQINKGDAIIINYEGPKGGPGMQEMLYPTSYLKSKGLDKDCALITDGRFSGGTSGLSIGHISPEAAAGGEIALIKDNDIIEIDIPNRTIHLAISDKEIDKRRLEEKSKPAPFSPTNRDRIIPASLKAYASLVGSADTGASRII